jgi:hypothetical protein
MQMKGALGNCDAFDPNRTLIVAIEPEVEGFSMCALARATCLGILRTKSGRSEMNAETIVDKLNATIVAAMRDAPTTKRLVDVGIDPATSTPEKLRHHIAQVENSGISSRRPASRRNDATAPRKPSAVSEESQR